MQNLKIATSRGGFRDTALMPYPKDWLAFKDELRAPAIGSKDGSYFVRSLGTHRSNSGLSSAASILILDGDSRITNDGEVLSGAPDPQAVHEILASLGWSHCLYSSYSNGAEGDDYHKYRVIIPCEYTRALLPMALDWIFDRLHELGVMLFPVSENRVWSQPWYFPRVPAERLHLFKCFEHDGQLLDVGAIVVEQSNKHSVIQEPRPIAHIKRTYEGGQIDPIALFNEYWKSPVNYLLTLGYKAKGRKLLHPNSQSGIAGVQVCKRCADGVERVFSHGGDALNDGFSHDSFDCYRIIEHGGDFNAALQEIGRTFMVNGLSVETHNRTLFRINRERSARGVVHG